MRLVVIESNSQQRYLKFISGLSDLLSTVTPDDLMRFRHLARRGFADLLPVIDACIKMVGRARPPVERARLVREQSEHPSASEHLFDLLRSMEHGDAAGSFLGRLDQCCL